MSPISMLLVVSLLSQTSDASDAVDPAETVELEPDELEAEAPKAPELFDRSNTGVRLLGEVGGAVAVAAATYAVGYYFVVLPEWCRTRSEDCESGAWIEPFRWAMFAFGPGAWLGGLLAGGQSAWWAPILGNLAGVAAAYVALAVAGFPGLYSVGYPIDWYVAYALSLAGTIGAAELSHFAEVHWLRPQAVAPLLTSDGSGVVLVWRF